MTKKLENIEISVQKITDAILILAPAVKAAKNKHDYQTILAALLCAAGAFAEDLGVLPEEQARFSVEMRDLAVQLGA